MDDQPLDEPDGNRRDSLAEAVGRTAALRARSRAATEQIASRFEALRARSHLVDLAWRVLDRDREAAGTLLGSALALRLFLFLMPMVLFSVGLAGLIGHYADYRSLSADARITGAIGEQVDVAFSQSSTSAWLVIGTGLLGMATAGRSLSRALILSSAVSWRLGGRQRTTFGVIGSVVGLLVCIGLLATIVNIIRSTTGVAVASVSFVAVFGVYVVLWIFVFQALPRGTSDPGASLPGSLLAAGALTILQAVSTLFLPGAVDRSSELYGAIGVSLAILGWIYVLGRAIAFSFSLNAVVFEQVGSLSGLVFSLPGLRALPRRYPPIARYFDLEQH
jgi:uncharacterized BrkB/YihY/UPF0761 family membrane protein